MRRLLDDFERVFDLDYRIRDTSLGQLVEQTVSGLETRPLKGWGAEGSRESLVRATDRFVSFHYRPHLFPGMDLKLRLAHELQFHLLPRQLPVDAPVSIAAVLESFCHLSGDLFGWEMLGDGKFLIWIVDMAGHGVRAGLASAVLRILVDNLRERSRLELLFGELNRALCGCIRPRYDGLYATAFFLALDSDGRGSYASAGHPPILLRRASGPLEELASLDHPIGLFDESSFHSRPIRLERGDGLLLYTDGLIEAPGRDGEAFGRDRLRRLVRPAVDAPEQLTRAIYDEVAARQDVDHLEDDITFLAAHF